MDRSEFQSEFFRMSEANGIFLNHKFDQIADIVFERERSPVFGNVIRGSLRNEYLLVTAESSYRLRTKMFGVHIEWIIDHSDLVDDAWHRRGMSGGYVLDEVVLQHRGGTDTFWIGFNDPRGGAGTERQIAEHNCEVAADQINGARHRGQNAAQHDTRWEFDPDGPENAANAAEAAYRRGDFQEALALSVVAVDKLHDFYVFEQFRNREPSPKDAWIIRGLGKALDAARMRSDNVDVREHVRTATHRLRTIASAVDGAGGNSTLYRSALDELARCAPDIDVSDIFWS